MMARPRHWFYELFILLLLFLPVILVEAISHVPLDLMERDLRASPVKRLTSKHPNEVKKKALCDHCCGSSCWWDESAAVCRCPHLPSIVPKKHPPIPSMTLASLARSQFEREDKKTADNSRDQ